MGGASLPPATPTEERALLLSPNLVPGAKRGRGTAEEQSWEKIIPASLVAEVEEEERQREQMQLYLPPRQRRVKVHVP